MKIELAEISQGSCKGFKYFYPVFGVEDWLMPISKSTFSNYSNGDLLNILFILNKEIKQSYSSHIQELRAPLRLMKTLSPEAFKAVGEGLAKMYPDGILNTREEVITNPPWKKAS